MQIRDGNHLGSRRRASALKIVANVKPELRCQTERLDIYSFVVTVKATHEIARFEIGAKKSGSVSDRAEISIDASVSKTDDELR